MDKNRDVKENNIYNYTEVESIRRGSVYYVKRNVDCNFYSGTAITLKNKRPFIVLSEHRDNTYSRIVTCCPIITREEKGNEHFEYVNFVDSRGKHVMVNLSQITCIPIEHVKGYIYTVPKEKMDEIDRLIARRLCLEGYIESLVKQYIEDISGMAIGHAIDLDMHVRKEEPLSVSNVRDMLRKHNIQLQDITNKVDECEEKDEDVPPSITILHPEEPENVKNYDSVITGDLKPKRSTDKKWSYETMKELVDYYRANGTEKTAEKYNLKKNSLATLLWKAKRKYGINNEKEAGY